MIRQYELVDRVLAYNPDADEALLNRAYVYAMRAHGHQVRASGDPYFSHPLEVAAILTDFRLDDATIAVALLHDTIEDTDTTRREIDTLFGAEIGTLVEGLTKLKKLDEVSYSARQGENLRKLLLAIAEDVRVLLVKLADRLHNMRTLSHVPMEKRARIAEETMDIYAPLASRMGIRHVAEELENLAFQTLQSDHHAAITDKLANQSEQNEKITREIANVVKKSLAAHDVSAQVVGRRKAPYSIFRKMKHKSVSFEQLSDIYGFRIIVDAVEDCYRALGVVHTAWPMVPGRFKDYISTPKQNEYRSLHTTIVGPGRQRVELQIRTKKMETIAEHGVAAHFLYKEHQGVQAPDAATRATADTGIYAWLHDTIALLSSGDSPEEFLEHTKLELFQDQVFCFTPHGRLISLPSDATPIDFAYAVHTEIGNQCTGCKIDGQARSLLSTLENGDEVEILCSATHVPPPAWIDIVRTGKAKVAIRRATNKARLARDIDFGREILRAAFKRSRRTYSDKSIDKALPRLSGRSVEDVLAHIGRGEWDVDIVLGAVMPHRVKRPVAAEFTGKKKDMASSPSTPGTVATAAERRARAILIGGNRRGLSLEFSERGAVPGDRIVGIREADGRIVIYPIQSPVLRNLAGSSDQWIELRWDTARLRGDLFPATLGVTARNEPGTLAAIAEIISDVGGNIGGIHISGPLTDFKNLTLNVDVNDAASLETMVAEISALANVSTCQRLLD